MLIFTPFEDVISFSIVLASFPIKLVEPVIGTALINITDERTTVSIRIVLSFPNIVNTTSALKSNDPVRNISRCPLTHTIQCSLYLLVLGPYEVQLYLLWIVQYR